MALAGATAVHEDGDESANHSCQRDRVVSAARHSVTISRRGSISNFFARTRFRSLIPTGPCRIGPHAGFFEKRDNVFNFHVPVTVEVRRRHVAGESSAASGGASMAS